MSSLRRSRATFDPPDKIKHDALLACQTKEESFRSSHPDKSYLESREYYQEISRILNYYIQKCGEIIDFRIKHQSFDNKYHEYCETREELVRGRLVIIDKLIEKFEKTGDLLNAALQSFDALDLCNNVLDAGGPRGAKYLIKIVDMLENYATFKSELKDYETVTICFVLSAKAFAILPSSPQSYHMLLKARDAIDKAGVEEIDIDYYDERCKFSKNDIERMIREAEAASLSRIRRWKV